MGLDISFFTLDRDEVCYLRNHLDFFEFFVTDGERVDPEYDDTYVDLDMLFDSHTRLLKALHDRGLSPEKVPDSLSDEFFLGEPENSDIALPAYVRLCEDLIRHCQASGVLICAMSA